ncbi:MAG TPA: T9SS type A sorting domain-containing protein, partial [Flavobacteriales bacterium]|nr:T9SS type A sorting domain-containing protein [Flavobacteriales bacterium]
LIASLSIALATMAQGQVDIGLFHNDNGQLEVKVRPSSDFDGIFSSLVFALRWDKGTDIVLGDVAPPAASPYINTMRSGAQREDGTFAYQVFAGFGYQPMQGLGMHWEAGHEYTILTIPVSGRGAVELVNDAWTREETSNADFYAALGGADHTGHIYKSVAATTDLGGTVLIQPNPNEGRFMFSFVSDSPSDIRVEMLNTLGQSVLQEQLRGFEGSFRKDMDLTSMSDGIYYLRITRGETTSVHKIIYH